MEATLIPGSSTAEGAYVMNEEALFPCGSDHQFYESGVEPFPLVTFFIGQQEYAVEGPKVIEISRVREIAAAPVIDLRKRFGFEVKEPDEHSRIIFVNAGRTVGLLVDTVSEMLRLPLDALESLSETDEEHPEWAFGIGRTPEGAFLLVDVERLADTETAPVVFAP